jgi:formylglycine-generating enzyme required for sulfatase activity
MQKLIRLLFILLFPSLSASAQLFTLKFTTTADCKLYIDGEYKTTLVTDGIYKIDFRAGDYQIKAVSTANTADVFKTFYTVNKEDLGMQKIYEIDLQNIIQNRLDNEKRIEEEQMAAEKAAREKAEAEVRLREAEKAMAEKAEAERLKREQQKAVQETAIENKTASFSDNLAGDFVFVKGGTFTMGCTKEQGNCALDEKPVHDVTLNDFYLAKYEVTQALWTKVMGNNPSQFYTCAECPVEKIYWTDAQEFIQKLNQMTGQTYRLPTEAEWEYAGRGGMHQENFQYAGSTNIEEVAWTSTNSEGKTHPVGQKSANALGLYDMTGNVYEWCNDGYSILYYRNSPSENPPGDAKAEDKVLRGGSYRTGANDSHISSRHTVGENYRVGFIGFRLAHD